MFIIFESLSRQGVQPSLLTPRRSGRFAEEKSAPQQPTEIYTAYARKYYLDKLYRPFEN